MGKSTKDDLEAVRVLVDALEGFDANDQERILRWAREKLGLMPGVSEQRPRIRSDINTPPGIEASASSASFATSSDIKTFVEKKNPTSDTQFATTVAYYYRFEAPPELRKESINGDDLIEACRLVGRRRIKHVPQTLTNALSQGLLNRGERGLYTINTVGENLVALALPTDIAKLKKRPPKKVSRKSA